jgi:DedD protein
VRDGNRLKEKIELRLDQRQVASFAVIALLLTGAVFALGVLVGTRLAAMPGSAPPKPDNLLDRLDAKAAAAGMSDGGNDGLTFQEELTKPRAPLPPVPKPPKPVPPKVKQARADAGSPAPPGQVAIGEGRSQQARKPGGDASSAPSQDTADEALDAPFFTVQVKATQSQPDASHFASKLKGEGYQPFIADVDLPGKGHWYRVRVGHFDTRAQADRYLADFKRETHLEAFVTAAGH